MEILEEVLKAYDGYDYNLYTKDDVLTALSKDTVSAEDYKALLSPAAMEFLEPMARRAKKETMKHFGNTVCLFTPLYIANYCVNHCVYCGFNCTNKIHRAKLTMEEIEREYKAIAKTGLKEILILTGESKKASGVEYIGEAVELALRVLRENGPDSATMWSAWQRRKFLPGSAQGSEATKKRKRETPSL